VAARAALGRWVAAEAPPFTLKEIRQAIPSRCFSQSGLRSSSYLAADLLGIAALASVHLFFCPPGALGALASSAYAIAQGTLFWSLFVVGHDCGHGSFARSKRVNNWVGHLTHSLILVPFHPWRISHAKVRPYSSHAPLFSRRSPVPYITLPRSVCPLLVSFSPSSTMHDTLTLRRTSLGTLFHRASPMK
jgi:hypothetical protein